MTPHEQLADELGKHFINEKAGFECIRDDERLIEQILEPYSIDLGARTIYFVILFRPEGSKTWTPLNIPFFLHTSENFFASPESAQRWMDHDMPDGYRMRFLSGPKKTVPVEFKIGKVVINEIEGENH